MDDFLKSCKDDYHLWRDEPQNFKIKLRIIEQIYRLKEKSKLRHSECPVYFSGNYKNNNSFVIFGLNPGKQKPWEKKFEEKKRDSWKSYLDYMQNRFLYSRDTKFHSYYSHFWNLFEGLMRIKKMKIPPRWEFFHNKVLSVNLMPYHSVAFDLRKAKNQSQINHLKKDIKQRLEFVKKNVTNPRLLIFHGAIWLDMLDKLGFVKLDDVYNVKKKFKMYYFKINSRPCVLFNMFLPSAYHEGVGIPDEARKIPKLILERYPDLY